MVKGVVTSIITVAVLMGSLLACGGTQKNQADDEPQSASNNSESVSTGDDSVSTGDDSVSTGDDVEEQLKELEETQDQTQNTAAPASLATLANPPALHPYSGTSALAEAIATQVESGAAESFNCELETIVLSEACHLFKTAIYVTQSGLQPGDPPANPTPDDIRNAHTDPAFHQNYAIVVMNAIPILVSRDVYGLSVNSFADYVSPGVDAEEILSSGSGICGQQTLAALAFFEAAHIEARALQFWYTKDGDATDRRGHVIVEVLVGDEFKPIDTTYGAYWVREDGSMATTAEMTLDNVVWNEALAYINWFGTERYDPFEYLRPEHRASVTRGEHGTITYYLEETGFNSIPNFIGDNKVDGYTGGTSFRVEGEGTTTVTVSAYAGADAQICLDANCEPITSAGGTFTFENAGNGNLHIDGFIDLGYAVITSIETK